MKKSLRILLIVSLMFTGATLAKADTVTDILTSAVGAVLGVLGLQTADVIINRPTNLTVNNPQNVFVNKTPIPFPTVQPPPTVTPSTN